MLNRFLFIVLLILLVTVGCEYSSEPETTIYSPSQEEVTLSASLAKAAAGGRVFVVFDDVADPNLVESLGGKVVYSYHIVPAVAATAPADVIKLLANHPRVIRIEPDGEVHAIDHPTGDSELDNSWGVAHIGSGNVHVGGNKGSGVKVGILDSGIDYNHPDLDANFAGGHDFVNNDTDPKDDNGHGTHVAGTVAAEDNDIGVVGVAPEASLYALKVLSSSGSGSWSDIIAALDWATDPNGDGNTADHLDVTNNSYGSSINPGGTVKAAFDNSAAAGILHVAAAGNAGNPKGKGNNVGYPARFESVIAVAATDQNDNRASFSSTGDQVELAAPGVKINSTKLGGGYVEFNGTSMASPHVAGTAALVIAAGIPIAEVRELLQTTADDLGDPGRDPLYGYGLVDADEAAAPSGPVNNAPTVTITSPDDASTFDSGVTILFEGTASDTEDDDLDLTASLAWTSNINGSIGVGSSFSTTLSDGEHTITAKVTDSGGKTGSASIGITVGTPPPAPSLIVTVSTDKASYVNKENVIITHTVTDGTNPVEGAAVHSVITTAKGRKLSADGTTDGNGVVTLTYKVNSKRDGEGTYTVDATASKTGFESGSGSTSFEVK